MGHWVGFRTRQVCVRQVWGTQTDFRVSGPWGSDCSQSQTDEGIPEGRALGRS